MVPSYIGHESETTAREKYIRKKVGAGQGRGVVRNLYLQPKWPHSRSVCLSRQSCDDQACT